MQSEYCKGVKVSMALELERLALTSCGRATGWAGGRLYSLHGASPGSDAMCSELASTFGLREYKPKTRENITYGVSS